MVVRPTFGKLRRIHAERLQNTALDEFIDWKSIPALERKLQQHVTCVGINALLARFFACGRSFAGVEHVEKFGQRV